MGSLSDMANSSMAQRKETSVTAGGSPSAGKKRHALQVNRGIQVQQMPANGTKLTEMYDCVYEGLGFAGIQGSGNEKKIDGWSPRNIRKLVIGVDAVLAVYHIPYNGKYTKLVSLKKAYQKMCRHIRDLRKQQKQMYYYPILSLLDTSNWSNYALGGLEEIVLIRPLETLKEKDLMLMCGQFQPRNQQELMAYAQREGMFGIRSLQNNRIIHYKGTERIQFMESYVNEELDALYKYMTPEAVEKTFTRLASVSVIDMDIPLLSTDGYGKERTTVDCFMSCINRTDYKRNGTDANRYRTYYEYVSGVEGVKQVQLMHADGWQTGLPKGAANRFIWESADGELTKYFKELVAGYKEEAPETHKEAEVDMPTVHRLESLLKCMKDTKIQITQGSPLITVDEAKKITEKDSECGHIIHEMLRPAGYVGNAEGDFTERSRKLFNELYGMVKKTADSHSSRVRETYPLMHKVAVAMIDKEMQGANTGNMMAGLSRCFTEISYMMRKQGYNYNALYWKKRLEVQ